MACVDSQRLWGERGANSYSPVPQRSVWHREFRGGLSPPRQFSLPRATRVAPQAPARMRRRTPISSAPPPLVDVIVSRPGAAGNDREFASREKFSAVRLPADFSAAEIPCVAHPADASPFPVGSPSSTGIEPRQRSVFSPPGEDTVHDVAGLDGHHGAQSPPGRNPPAHLGRSRGRGGSAEARSRFPPSPENLNFPSRWRSPGAANGRSPIPGARRLDAPCLPAAAVPARQRRKRVQWSKGAPPPR